MEETKHCPYCDEIIRANAIKCKHCGSILTDHAVPTGEITPESQVKAALANRFEILEEVGRGGMASVYKAVQKNLNRTVALKVIHKNLVHYKEFLERFHREAQLSASLNHPNIVTIYDQGSENSIHYISMEYLEGLNLHHMIRDKGRLSTEESINIIAPVSEALDYAHNKGIIHRDIKSSNIIITSDGRSILTDFGIAHAVTATKLTQSGMIIGTPDYMSPEQAISGQVDAQSDLYSLGVVLYECITGDLPFKGETPVSTIYKIINEKIEPINKIVPDAPKWVGTVINKVLAKNKKNRFISGQEFSKALRAKQEQKEDFSASNNETIKITTKEFENVKKKYHPLLYRKNIFAIAAISVLLVVLGYFLYDNGYFPFSREVNEGTNWESLNEFERKRVRLLLEEGDMLFERGKYIEPAGENAAEKFAEAVKINTGNQHASEQLKQISDRVEKDLKSSVEKNDLSTAEKILSSAEIYFPSSAAFKNFANQIKVKELEIEAGKYLYTDPVRTYNICKEIKALAPDNFYVSSVLPEIRNSMVSYADKEYDRGNVRTALDNYNQIKVLFGNDSYIDEMISKCTSKVNESGNLKVPNLIGLSLQKAESTISRFGLSKGKVSEIISHEKNKGKVINQIPKAGSNTKKGSVINLIVGK
ncbi:MAG TPA: protein kinase [Ignavibacteriaceae bacterium]|nr:protein kinase [Ignavibacteriaceae bacterium]